MLSCSTRRHVFPLNENAFLLAQQPCWTRRHVFLLDKKTCPGWARRHFSLFNKKAHLLVGQEDIFFCSAERHVFSVEHEDMSSTMLNRKLNGKTCLLAEHKHMPNSCQEPPCPCMPWGGSLGSSSARRNHLACMGWGMSGPPCKESCTDPLNNGPIYVYTPFGPLLTTRAQVSQHRALPPWATRASPPTSLLGQTSVSQVGRPVVL